MARLIGKKALHLVVSHLDGVKHEVHQAAKHVGDKADAALTEARASTQWHKIYGPDHLTRIVVEQGDVDSFVTLEAPNAMAIEFGHAPSGVFAGTATRPPRGLYILGKSSGLAG
jgi:hypothetical protein